MKLENHRAVRRLLVLGHYTCRVALGWISLCPASLAQTAGASESEEPPTRLGRLTVSAGRPGDLSNSIDLPVEIISLATIQRSGAATNLQEALRRTVPQFMGSANLGAEDSTHRSGGGSSLALRNLRTLVLLDGRRVVTSPIAGHGAGEQFVDLNVIPLGAISSVEILRDGGSSQYGTDAVGGVVNITTLTGRRGGTLDGFYELAQGGWEHRGVNFSLGRQRGRTHLMVAGGWRRQDPLRQFQRAFSNPRFGSSNFEGTIRVGGYFFVLNPALAEPPVSEQKPMITFPMKTAPRAPDGRPYFGVVGSDAVYWGRKDAAGDITGFALTELARGTTPEAAQVALNLAPWGTLLQARTTRAGFLALEHDLNEHVSAFVQMIASDNDVFSQHNPQGFGGPIAASHPHNPFDSPVSASARIVFAPRAAHWRSAFGRLLTGLRGQTGDGLRFDTALNLNRSKLNFNGPGLVAIPLMQSAATAGRLNLFQRTLPAQDVAAAGIIGEAAHVFVSTLYSWDGRASWEPIRIPAGAVHLTVGADHRREGLDGVGDKNSTPDPTTGAVVWGGGVPASRFGAGRSVSALFAAAKVPVLSSEQNVPGLRQLEATIDVRAERYSDMADPVVPRTGFSWSPFGPGFRFRGGFGRSFNAPTLFQLYGPPNVTMTTVDLMGVDSRRYSGRVHLQNVSNSTLRPERARHGSVGIVWSPVRAKGLAVELDYVRVSRRDVVGALPPLLVLEDAERRGAESPYVAGHANSLPVFDVRRDTGFAGNGAPVTAPGQIAPNLESVYLTNPVVNLGVQDVEALDLRLTWERRFSAVHVFEASMRMAYTARHEADGREMAGRATVESGSIPRWSAITTMHYRRGTWQVNVLHRAIASMYAVSDGLDMGNYQTFDLGVGYLGYRDSARARGFEVSLMVKNVGDVAPPRAPFTFTANNADIGTYDALGRRWLVMTTYRF